MYVIRENPVNSFHFFAKKGQRYEFVGEIFRQNHIHQRAYKYINMYLLLIMCVILRVQVILRGHFYINNAAPLKLRKMQFILE